MTNPDVMHMCSTQGKQRPVQLIVGQWVHQEPTNENKALLGLVQALQTPLNLLDKSLSGQFTQIKSSSHDCDDIWVPTRFGRVVKYNRISV